MDKRTKGCLWIALGTAIALVMVAAVFVGGAGYWIYQEFAPRAEFLPAADAARQLDALRARFAGQQPLIDVEDDDGHKEATIHPERRPGTHKAPLTAIQIAAFDARAGKLVRFTIPFWLLRLAPHGQVSIGDDVLRDIKGRERLTVNDLEALGPGLLIDETRPDGHRVLVWTE
jgi:hypothetical protein